MNSDPKAIAPGPIAIIGGGISGLAAAYELARQGREFTLFEASGRLGGIIETVRTNGFVIEAGPDSWVAEKPWARELAIELGLTDQIVSSNDQWRRTYLVRNGKQLIAMPDGMRMMIPTKWAPIMDSPLFSSQARLAYLREPKRAQELKSSAPLDDESVAEFVCRHFGEEVTNTIAGPLLAGVFGGDIRELSVRAVMPAFVKMEAEHGSLIAALQQRAQKVQSSQPIFCSLANGLETFAEELAKQLPPDSVQLHQPVTGIHPETVEATERNWRVTTGIGEYTFPSIVLATPPHVARELLRPLPGNGSQMADLLPERATSAIVVALAFEANQAARMRIPRGFGFLVLPDSAKRDIARPDEYALLACTFVDQKFPHRAPAGAILLRAFFGGEAGEALLGQSDETVERLARQQLARILGPLPQARETVVRRWPLSLPQYAVGHLERIARLETLARTWRGLYLIGSGYHGVGLPDLIREGRATALQLLEDAI